MIIWSIQLIFQYTSSSLISNWKKEIFFNVLFTTLAPKNTNLPVLYTNSLFCTISLYFTVKLTKEFSNNMRSEQGCYIILSWGIYSWRIIYFFMLWLEEIRYLLLNLFKNVFLHFTCKMYFYRYRIFNSSVLWLWLYK